MALGQDAETTGITPSHSVDHSSPNTADSTIVGNQLQLGVREALAALEEEITRARAAHPGNTRMMAALFEEVGELAEELLQEWVDGTRMRKEALQVACVAIRIAEELDPKKNMPRERELMREAELLGHRSRKYLERMAVLTKEADRAEVSPC